MLGVDVAANRFISLSPRSCFDAGSEQRERRRRTWGGRAQGERRPRARAINGEFFLISFCILLVLVHLKNTFMFHIPVLERK